MVGGVGNNLVACTKLRCDTFHSMNFVQGKEVAEEAYDPPYISSPSGRSYSPARKMLSVGEALPDTVSIHDSRKHVALML